MKQFEIEKEVYLYNIKKVDGYFYSIVRRYRNDLELLSILLNPRNSNELDYAYHYLNFFHMEGNIAELLNQKKLNIPVEENTAVKFIISLKDIYNNQKALRKRLNVFDETVEPSEYARIISDSVIMQTYMNDAKKYISESVGFNVSNKTLNFINKEMYSIIMPPLDNIYITERMKKVDGEIRKYHFRLLFTDEQIFGALKELVNEVEEAYDIKL